MSYRGNHSHHNPRAPPHQFPSQPQFPPPFPNMPLPMGMSIPIPPSNMPFMNPSFRSMPDMPMEGTNRSSNFSQPKPAASSSTVQVWVGKIGNGILDKQMRRLLDIIGGVVSWKRTVDQKSGILKTFGFAEFVDPIHAYGALKLLNELPFGDSKLHLKCDEKNQKKVDAFLAQNEAFLPTQETEQSLKNEIKACVEEVGAFFGIEVDESSFPRLWRSSESSEPVASQASQYHPNSSSSENTPSALSTNVPLISSSQQTTSTLANQISESNSEQTPSQIISSAPSIHGSHDDQSITVSMTKKRGEEERKRELEKKLEMMKDERNAEQRRKERNEMNYNSLLREFDHEQRERLYAMSKRQKQDEESRMERADDMAQDNIDSDSWYKVIMSPDRVKARRREKEEDARMKNEEDNQRRRQSQKEDHEKSQNNHPKLNHPSKGIKRNHTEQHDSSMSQMEITTSKKPKLEEPGEISSDYIGNQSRMNDHETNSTIIQLGGSKIEEKSSTGKKMEAHRIHATSPSTSSPSNVLVNTHDTSSKVQPIQSSASNQRQKQIDLLSSQIPVSNEELFKLQVNIPSIQSRGIVELVLKPWIKKRLVEMFEEADEELLSFILTQLSSKDTSPAQLTESLRVVLDEDSEKFVAGLWRIMAVESLKID